ncbi:MAG: hypothetical protein Q9227_005529 [Pyrenula ochraceoflavens]
MEVELYVYDLSQGLARQWSLALTGVQLDAIYHTSLVFGGVEYFFGSGIQRKVPGSTHHGRPVQILKQGQTEIPQPVIEEYMESLTEIYTAESYDLFLHNCNNFTQDLSMFLTGKEIPAHIRDLPDKVLNTPFGQMLKPQIDQAMRGVTQGGEDVAPASSTSRSATNGVAPISSATNGKVARANGVKDKRGIGKVHHVKTLSEASNLLEAALTSCAIIFFTSSTCEPCKIVYPTFDSLAEEAGSKCTFIKIDLNYAERDLAAAYNVRAMPTFMTFLKGDKENEWSGADPSQLSGNVTLLIQMAWPEHPHKGLHLPTFSRENQAYALYPKSPPLDKLLAKIPADIQARHDFKPLIDFVRVRATSTAAEAQLPSLDVLQKAIVSLNDTENPSIQFATTDLLRAACADPRVSGSFASHPDMFPLSNITPKSASTIPHNTHIVTLQLLCNLFSSPLFPALLVEPSSAPLLDRLVTFATDSLLGTKPAIRHLAAALMYNLALYNHNARVKSESGGEPLNDGVQIDMISGLVHAIGEEKESAEALNGLLRALGMLVYLVRTDGAVVETLRVLDTGDVLKAKGKEKGFERERLLDEVGRMVAKLGA